MSVCDGGWAGLLRVLCLIMCSAGLVFSSDCDWTGSGGLAGGVVGGHNLVTRVQLNCAAGRVLWRYPRGALSVHLQLAPVTTSSPYKQQFSGCLRLASDFSASFRIWQRSGAKLLKVLWPGIDGQLNSGQPGLSWICFWSTAGEVNLFIEPVMWTDSLSLDSFSFDYDLQLDESPHTDHEGCRVCSQVEALDNFCSSDSVLKGRILDVNRNQLTKLNHLSVQVETILYDNGDISDENSHASDDQAKSVGNLISLWTSGKCVVPNGGDLYILMTRRRLDVAMVTCWLLAADWKTLKLKAEIDGASQCELRD